MLKIIASELVVHKDLSVMCTYTNDYYKVKYNFNSF